MNITITDQEAALLRELLRSTRKTDPRDVAAQTADALLTALGDGSDLATLLDRDDARRAQIRVSQMCEGAVYDGR